jgi:hypothetical protein
VRPPPPAFVAPSFESVTLVNTNALRSFSGIPPRNCQRTSGCSSVSLLIGRSTCTRSPAAPAPSNEAGNPTAAAPRPSSNDRSYLMSCQSPTWADNAIHPPPLQRRTAHTIPSHQPEAHGRDAESQSNRPKWFGRRSSASRTAR